MIFLGEAGLWGFLLRVNSILHSAMWSSDFSWLQISRRCSNSNALYIDPESFLSTTCFKLHSLKLGRLLVWRYSDILLNLQSPVFHFLIRLFAFMGISVIACRNSEIIMLTMHLFWFSSDDRWIWALSVTCELWMIFTLCFYSSLFSAIAGFIYLTWFLLNVNQPSCMLCRSLHFFIKLLSAMWFQRPCSDLHYL